jgi:trimethylamine-N-oxide reductase (cytochrome c)
MFYRYGGSFIGTMSDTNKWVKMYQSPKLEFVVTRTAVLQ